MVPLNIIKILLFFINNEFKNKSIDFIVTNWLSPELKFGFEAKTISNANGRINHTINGTNR